MGSTLRWLITAIVALELSPVAETRSAESVSMQPTTHTKATRGAVADDLTPGAILSAMKRVADWQLANPSQHPATHWTQAAGYAGMLALASVSDDPKYHAAMMEMGRRNGWKPRDPQEPDPNQKDGTGPAMNHLYFADDHCVLQTYLELYLQHHDPQMVAPARQRCDQIMATPPKDENDLTFTRPLALEKWVWCDALFMSPPVWVRLFAATGEKKYLDFMNERWWRTSDHLYDKEEHLYYRDDRYLMKREANGKKVFWCRGDGWVMGGLARVLQYLPTDYPDRLKYVAQFREMAARLATLQCEDGLWHASLLDPHSYPIPDSSGSGFILYGLTWGVNQKLLTRAEYEPVIRRAWQGLVRCVDATGRLEFVQPIGVNPVTFNTNSTDVYGVGAFLLAGSELYHFTQFPATESQLHP